MENTLRLIKLMSALLLLNWGLLVPTHVQAQDEITWYVNEWAPYNITRGKLKRKGINDKLIRLLHTFMPNYEISWRNMSPKLLNQAFTNGENICQLDMFKTPQREKIAYFTKFPAVIDAPLQIFIKARDSERLGLTPPVDINQLFNQSQFTASFVFGRSYSKEIDGALNKYKGNNIKRDESTKRLIKQFFRGKTDYVVEYSAVMNYFKSMLKSKKDMLSFPIKNTEPYVLGYTACSKTLWGKTTIDRIDAILKEQRHSEQYKAILEQWHDDRSKSLIINNYHNF